MASPSSSSDCMLIESGEGEEQGGGAPASSGRGGRDEGDVLAGCGTAAVPPSGGAAGGDGEDDEEEEDLMVVGEKAGILDALPHARPECPTRRFTRDGAAASNALFCPRCYCFVCDIPASECEAWSSSGHCHAFLDAGMWTGERDARRLRRHSALQAGPPSSLSHMLS